MAKIDLTGQRFGKLLVLREGKPSLKSSQRTVFWLCLCDCGVRKSVDGASLRSGRQISCGCERNRTARMIMIKHGQYKTREHRIWRDMRQRCKNPNTKFFKYYGGRGVGVDPRWDDFEMFLMDMGPRPSSRHTLERKDNSQGYGPGNCVWATRKQQSRNTRTNRRLSFHGQILCVAEWAEKLGVKYETIRARLAAGWSEEKTLSTPVRGRK